jgi:hypothetical protein
MKAFSTAMYASPSSSLTISPDTGAIVWPPAAALPLGVPGRGGRGSQPAGCASQLLDAGVQERAGACRSAAGELWPSRKLIGNRNSGKQQEHPEGRKSPTARYRWAPVVQVLQAHSLAEGAVLQQKADQRNREQYHNIHKVRLGVQRRPAARPPPPPAVDAVTLHPAQAASQSTAPLGAGSHCTSRRHGIPLRRTTGWLQTAAPVYRAPWPVWQDGGGGGGSNNK